MARVIDYQLHRWVDHNHVTQFNNLYLLKAGDTATGTIFFPITNSQGCALINAINASTTCQIQAVRISIADAGGYYTSTDVEGALQEIASSGGFIIAGTGLTKTGATINANAADNSITMNADNFAVKLDPIRSITVSANGIGILLDGTTLIQSGTGLKVNIIGRSQLDTTTTGEAVIRKIIAGTNVTISSTGIDSGTGDVTINSRESWERFFLVMGA